LGAALLEQTPWKTTDSKRLCHVMSCKQFANGSDAIRAIETKAALWIDDRESNPRTDDVEPSLLS
jgi:hypothetical protein